MTASICSTRAASCSGCLLDETELLNGANDYLFVGSPFGGPSGIEVDNVGIGGQESMIYFGLTANNCAADSTSGCAVKVTQQGLN
jgi:hypothetical protein